MRAAADWIYGIAAVLLLSSAALQAVSEGTWQKYVKLFCGGLVILAVTAPLLTLAGRLGQTSLYYQRDTLSALFGGLEGSVPEGDEWRQEARKRQEEALREPLAALAESCGFTICSYTLGWKEETQIDAVTLTVRAADKALAQEEGTPGGADGILPVEAVEPAGPGDGRDGPGKDGAGTKEDAAAQGSYYEPSELRTLHEALETVLGLSSGQVAIYLQREGDG